MIRKERKARWVYACRRCNIERTSVDYFGAIEHQQRHERSLQHVSKAVETGLNAFVRGLDPIVRAWVEAYDSMGTFADVLSRSVLGAPPPAPRPPQAPGKIRGARLGHVIFDEAQRFNHQRGRTRR